jgi:MoxR-like ATPase
MTSPLGLDALGDAFMAQGYFADETLLTAGFLALELGRPILLEGAPGVGKTEFAKALAGALGRRVLRLQCYEGIDAGQALYEWNYARQLLAIRRQEAGTGGAVGEDQLYRPEFLIERPLLAAIRRPGEVVLLVDEIDRADDAFEALLLEFLSDFQISIPELGTFAAPAPVPVVLTSNRTRELADALRRRCLYHWIDYPEPARELAIVRAQVPGLTEEAARRLVAAVGAVRELALIKRPGTAESIEWGRGAAALVRGGAGWPDAFRAALGLLVKDQEDMETVRLAEVV